MFQRTIVVGIILLAVAVTPSFAQTTTPTTTPMTGIDLACMQLAVERRDNAILLAFGNKTAAVQTALTQRRDALKSAWGETSPRQRRRLRASAWTSYRELLIDAAQDYRQASRTTWGQFKASARTCRVPSNESGVDVSSSGNDQGL